jgi:hypothetical protein
MGEQLRDPIEGNSDRGRDADCCGDQREAAPKERDGAGQDRKETRERTKTARTPGIR